MPAARRVIGALEDYEAVHNLMAMVLSEGQHESLDAGVNEVVAAVSVTSMPPEGRGGVSQKTIVKHLEDKGTPVNKSTVSRRTAKALRQGYLVANPTAPGQPQQLRMGTPRGKLSAVLPPPEVLRKSTRHEAPAPRQLHQLRSCTGVGVPVPSGAKMPVVSSVSADPRRRPV